MPSDVRRLADARARREAREAARHWPDLWARGLCARCREPWPCAASGVTSDA